MISADSNGKVVRIGEDREPKLHVPGPGSEFPPADALDPANGPNCLPDARPPRMGAATANPENIVNALKLASMSPGHLGATAGMLAKGIRTFDSLGEISKNLPQTTEDISKIWNTLGASNSGKLSDPNNKILNTNDRSVLDHHQAVNGLLEGQLNNSRSVFIEHKDGDKKFLAFKYQDEKGGDVRSGKIELGKDGKFVGDWQSIPKEDRKLTADLDQAHKTKMAEIDNYTKKNEDRSVGVEKYRAAKSLEQDIKDLTHGSSGTAEQREALRKLGTKLSDKTQNLQDLRQEFNELVGGDQVLSKAFLDNRIEELQKASPGKFSGLAAEVHKGTDFAAKNKIINEAIDQHRNQQQALDDKAELDFSKIGRLQELTWLLRDPGSTPSLEVQQIIKTFNPEEKKQLESLMSASKTLRDSYDTKNPNQIQSKYLRDELAYLNSKIDPFLQKLPADSASSKSYQLNTRPKTFPPPPLQEVQIIKTPTS